MEVWHVFEGAGLHGVVACKGVYHVVADSLRVDELIVASEDTKVRGPNVERPDFRELVTADIHWNVLAAVPSWIRVRGIDEGSLVSSDTGIDLECLSSYVQLVSICYR